MRTFRDTKSYETGWSYTYISWLSGESDHSTALLSGAMSGLRWR